MNTGLFDRVVESIGALRRYVVFVPFGYDGTRAWPTILHLHGKGECGTDGLYQLWHGIPRELIKDRSKWPFLIICPQKADEDGEWFDEKPMLDAILAAVEREFKTDPHRRYLTGLSQGGRGTMRLATRLRWQFAAIAPVCGWVDDPVAIAKELVQIPAWLFHGEKDEAVPVSGSKDLARELENLGAKPKLTLYPNDGHFIWGKVYGEEKLSEWFLEHSLS